MTNRFASPLQTSHFLELINPLWATHKLQALVVDVRQETPGTATLTLHPGRSWQEHRTGQHIRLSVPIDGAYHTRTYSLSSPPGRADGCIAITVKALPGGLVSQHLVRGTRPGDFVSLGAPAGDFVLSSAVVSKVLFITAGIGITPIMSMLRCPSARAALPSIVHLHYAPDPHQVLFSDELNRHSKANPRYHLARVYTREPGDDSVARHFNARQLNELCPDWGERDVYACGPQRLLAEVEAHWQHAGLAQRLHIERFHAPWTDPPNDVTACRVQFDDSGVEVWADGRTNLLRVAEEAGLSPPYGCRMGLCRSCDTRLLSGRVRDLRTGALVDAPGGAIQLCINAAAGDVKLGL